MYRERRNLDLCFIVRKRHRQPPAFRRQTCTLGQGFVLLAEPADHTVKGGGNIDLIKNTYASLFKFIIIFRKMHSATIRRIAWAIAGNAS